MTAQNTSYLHTHVCVYDEQHASAFLNGEPHAMLTGRSSKQSHDSRESRATRATVACTWQRVACTLRESCDSARGSHDCVTRVARLCAGVARLCHDCVTTVSRLSLPILAGATGVARLCHEGRATVRRGVVRVACTRLASRVVSTNQRSRGHLLGFRSLSETFGCHKHLHMLEALKKGARRLKVTTLKHPCMFHA